MTVVHFTTELPWDAGSAGGAVARGRGPDLVSLCFAYGGFIYDTGMAPACAIYHVAPISLSSRFCMPPAIMFMQA